MLVPGFAEMANMRRENKKENTGAMVPLNKAEKRLKKRCLAGIVGYTRRNVVMRLGAAIGSDVEFDGDA